MEANVVADRRPLGPVSLNPIHTQNVPIVSGEKSEKEIEKEIQKKEKKWLRRKKLTHKRLKVSNMGTLGTMRKEQVCFKIPQVWTLNARFVEEGVRHIKYEVSVNGFLGKGVTRVGSKSCFVKVIPGFFDPDSFDPYNLANSEGSYPVQEMGLTVGFYTELSEEEFPNNVYDKDANDASKNKIIKLVFKGSDGFKVQGLTCLTAQIIHKEAKPDPNLTLPDENNLDQFYGIECEHERLFIFTNIVSPFQEDDNSVRIIVIPTTVHGTVLNNGDVLGSATLLEKSIDGNIRKRDDTSTKIISAIWDQTPPLFLDKNNIDSTLKKSKSCKCHSKFDPLPPMSQEDSKKLKNAKIKDHRKSFKENKKVTKDLVRKLKKMNSALEACSLEENSENTKI